MSSSKQEENERSCLTVLKREPDGALPNSFRTFRALANYFRTVWSLSDFRSCGCSPNQTKNLWNAPSSHTCPGTLFPQVSCKKKDMLFTFFKSLPANFTDSLHFRHPRKTRPSASEAPCLFDSEGHGTRSTRRLITVEVLAQTDNKSNETVQEGHHHEMASAHGKHAIVASLTRSSLRLNLGWRPRDQNQEADDLTNEIFDRFL